MAVVVATGIVNIRPDIDEGRTVRAGQTAGRNTGNAFVRGLDGRLRDSEGNLVNRASILGNTMGARLASRFLSNNRFDSIARGLGVNIINQLDDGMRSAGNVLIRRGDDIGNRVTRGIDGRLRDSRGRFVRSADDMAGSLVRIGGAAAGAGGSIAQMGAQAGPAGGALGGVAAAIGAIAAASALPAISALAPMMVGLIGVTKAASFAFDGVGEALGYAGEDAEKYAEALKEMSPEQRKFTEHLAGMKKGLEGFKKEIQKIVLPTFTQALKDAKPAISVFKEGIKGGAEVFRDFGKEFGKLFANKRFQSALQENFKLGNEFMREIMLTLDNFTLSFLEFGAKSKPVIEAFGGGFSDLLGKGIPGFFKGLEEGVGGSAAMFDGLFDMINKILPAFGELSGKLADTFGPFLGELFKRAGDLFRNFVDLVSPSIDALEPLFASLTELFGQTRGATDSLAKGLGQGLGAVVKVLVIPLKNLVDLFIIAAPIMKNLATTILSSVAPAFGKMNGSMSWADKMADFTKNNKLLFQQIFSAIADAVMEFVIAVVDNFPTVFSMWRTLSTIALESVNAIIQGLAKAFGWMPEIGPKIVAAADGFGKFKDKAVRDLDEAEGKIRGFSERVKPKLEENRLKMNIKNWELQLDTARADLKSVPPEKRAHLLATIRDLQNKIRDGKAALASVKDKNANIKGTNQTHPAVRAAIGALRGVKDRDAKIKATNQTNSAVSAARRAIAGINGKTVSILAKFSLGGAVAAAKKIFGFAAGGLIPGFASGGQINMWPIGGRIRGPGSGTSDSILARVSNGEFITRKRAVDYYGADFFQKLNQMKIKPAMLGADMSIPARMPSTTPAVASLPSASQVTKILYQFEPGAIVLDASKIRDIQDLLQMLANLRVTARQFGAKV